MTDATTTLWADVKIESITITERHDVPDYADMFLVRLQFADAPPFEHYFSKGLTSQEMAACLHLLADCVQKGPSND